MKNNCLLLLLFSIVGCSSNMSSFGSSSISLSSTTLSTTSKIEDVSSSSSLIKNDEPVTIDIYAFNDVHGRISENKN